mmetsp:Transcript_22434/g.21572  ORF Transcript_22434/g.21572 Transcript_22434/m.21572 type:complete len:219 (-) Transcript_22434:329-985(-)
MFKKRLNKIKKDYPVDGETASLNNRNNRWDRKAPLKKRLVVTHSASCEPEIECSAKKQRGKPLKLYRLEERKGMDVLSNLSYRIEIDHSIKELDDIMTERKSDTHRLKSSQITVLRRTIHTVKELLNLSRELKAETRKLKEQVKKSEKVLERLDKTSRLDTDNQKHGFEENATMMPCPYAISNMPMQSASRQFVYYPSSLTQQATFSTVINHYPTSPY